MRTSHEDPFHRDRALVHIIEDHLEGFGGVAAMQEMLHFHARIRYVTLSL